jgi:hypothetical protein
MVFHARKWGWKRIAANLLLIPVLTGTSAAVAHAQYNPVPQQMAGASVPGKPGAEAKAMLKEGRKALAAGQYDRAQDLARAAEANNPTGKWGVFDDTPNALLRDIQAAVIKAQKNEAGQLVKQAKTLLARPAANEAEKAANLDQALQLAQRADQLHGPYSAWDLSDRADKLAKDIQTARAKLKNAPAPAGMPPGGAVAGNMPNMPAARTNTPAFLPAGATGPAPGMAAGRPATPQADARKRAALQLLADGQKLASQGQYAAARAKYVEADRAGAAFAADEFNPGFALQDLGARAHKAVETLVSESQKQMAKKEYVKAEAALDTATEIASALGLFARPIEEARGQLRAATNGKFGGPAAAAAAAGTGVAPAGPAPERAGPLVGPTGPKIPSVPVSPIAGTTAPGPKPVAPAVGGTGGAAPVTNAHSPGGTAGITGRQLLDQAAYEFSRGELDTAAKLAMQAHNHPAGGVQDQARGLLNSIDAERLAQKKYTAVRSFDAAQAAFKNKDYSHALGVLVLVDENLLPSDDMKQRRKDLIDSCRTELNKLGMGTTVAAGGTQQVEPPLPVPGRGWAGPVNRRPRRSRRAFRASPRRAPPASGATRRPAGPTTSPTRRTPSARCSSRSSAATG